MLITSAFSQNAKLKTDAPEFIHYCIPVNSLIAQAIESANAEMKIDLEEFFYLNSCSPHSEETTKLIKDSNNRFRLDFIAVADNAYSILLCLNRMEGLQINSEKTNPKYIKELASAIVKETKRNGNFENDLGKLRKVKALQKEIAAKVWSVKGDGEE